MFTRVQNLILMTSGLSPSVFLSIVLSVIPIWLGLPACSALAQVESGSVALAAEQNLDAPEDLERFSYIVDGRLTEALDIPTYEWVPRHQGDTPRAIIVFVHGFTMHGRRFNRLAEVLAANNFHSISYDMYGFGRNFFTDKRPVIDGIGSKRRINYGKSHKKLVQLLTLVRKTHRDVPVYVLGESMGATPCLKLASEHRDLVDGVMLSAAAVQINPLLFAHPMSAFEATLPVVTSPHMNMRLNHFVNNMLSLDKDIKEDIKNDSEIRRRVTWIDLVKTQGYVAKAIFYAPRVKDDPPILYMVGARDLVVLPSDSRLLFSLINSKNKNFVRLKKRSHLLTETGAIKDDTVATIFEWLEERELSKKVAVSSD